MNNKQLADKLEQWADALAESGGQKWVLSVPVREDVDPDCLMIEAAKRLRLAPIAEPVEGMRWVKASEIEYVGRKTYCAKWNDNTGEEYMRGSGYFQISDGVFFWHNQGYIPIEKKLHHHLFILVEDESASSTPSAREAELEREVERVRSEYEEVLEDHRQLVRELDVLINGEAGAAKQASLCDIVGQVRREGAPCLKVVLSILGKAQAEGFLQGAEYHELARIFKHNL